MCGTAWPLKAQRRKVESAVGSALCQHRPSNRARPSATTRGPSSCERATRTEGTVPSHGGRGRSLNQQDATPCWRIRVVRAAISVSVMGDSCASRAMCQEPSGAVASTSARQEPSGARTSNSEWAPASRAAQASSSLRRWWASDSPSRAISQSGACGACAKNRIPAREVFADMGWSHSVQTIGARGFTFHTASHACPQPRSGRCAKTGPQLACTARNAIGPPHGRHSARVCR